MLTLKDWFSIIGFVLFGLGFMCLPIGYGASSKRDLSLFENFADMWAFMKTGVVLICAGLLVIILTELISKFLTSHSRKKSSQSPIQ